MRINTNVTTREMISPEKTIPYEWSYFFCTSFEATCFEITSGIPLQINVVKTQAIDNATVYEPSNVVLIFRDSTMRYKNPNILPRTLNIDNNATDFTNDLIISPHFIYCICDINIILVYIQNNNKILLCIIYNIKVKI